MDHGHAGLYIDDLGKVFMMTDSFELIAPSIELALYSLLLGIRLSPEELAAG
ncbi:MAG: hypothetical protein IPG74_09575 [Flavobacteriales bacterium]|nr:hypothetical protein [Flavobacteriales bacterium]